MRLPFSSSLSSIERVSFIHNTRCDTRVSLIHNTRCDTVNDPSSGSDLTTSLKKIKLELKKIWVITQPKHISSPNGLPWQAEFYIHAVINLPKGSQLPKTNTLTTRIAIFQRIWLWTYFCNSSICSVKWNLQKRKMFPS